MLSVRLRALERHAWWSIRPDTQRPRLHQTGAGAGAGADLRLAGGARRMDCIPALSTAGRARFRLLLLLWRTDRAQQHPSPLHRVAMEFG